MARSRGASGEGSGGRLRIGRRRLLVAAGAGAGLLAAGFAGCRQAPPTVPEPPPLGDERLGPGDRIEVRVFDEERFEGTYEVQGDGTIDFPYVGGIAVAGRTPTEAAALLRDRLADGYLHDPQVTVAIKVRENREVSVLGQVKEPGSLAYRERLTVVQAVSLAGGLTEFAAAKRVRITRGGETFEISLPAILGGAAEDLRLRPGDIVFVPESRI